MILITAQLFIIYPGPARLVAVILSRGGDCVGMRVERYPLPPLTHVSELTDEATGIGVGAGVILCLELFLGLLVFSFFIKLIHRPKPTL